VPSIDRSSDVRDLVLEVAVCSDVPDQTESQSQPRHRKEAYLSDIRADVEAEDCEPVDQRSDSTFHITISNPPCTGKTEHNMSQLSQAHGEYPEAADQIVSFNDNSFALFASYTHENIRTGKHKII
jgi:hypothetical protein